MLATILATVNHILYFDIGWRLLRTSFREPYMDWYWTLDERIIQVFWTRFIDYDCGDETYDNEWVCLGCKYWM